MDRFYKAAKKFKATNIVRICGDSPFVDPKIVDKIILKLKKNNLDYVSNTIEPTFPDGLDAEAFRFITLKKAWKNATSKYDCMVEHPEGGWLMNSKELQYVREKYSSFFPHRKYPDEN